MGRMKELFMQLREQEKIIENHDNIDDDYQYQQYIQNKYQSPKHICFMLDSTGAMIMLQGNTEQEIFEIALRHGLEGEFKIMSPVKHLF
jgi:hypothetical protein